MFFFPRHQKNKPAGVWDKEDIQADDHARFYLHSLWTPSSYSSPSYPLASWPVVLKRPRDEFSPSELMHLPFLRSVPLFLSLSLPLNKICLLSKQPYTFNLINYMCLQKEKIIQTNKNLYTVYVQFVTPTTL